MATVLVTGGSRGLGAAICREAAMRGHDVCFSYQSRDDAAEEVATAVRKNGRKAVPVRADLRRDADVAKLFEAARDAFGGLDALVNNAGITGPTGYFETTAQADIDAVIDVNLLGAMRCVRGALPLMAGRENACIVNITSGAAQSGSPGRYVGYAASKAGLETFTRGLAAELAPKGIRVNAVSPGVSDTDMHDASAGSEKRMRLERSIPLGRMARPEEIAHPVLWLMSAEASYVTGAVIRASGGR